MGLQVYVEKSDRKRYFIGYSRLKVDFLKVKFKKKNKIQAFVF